jgi:hypothetical protein
LHHDDADLDSKPFFKPFAFRSQPVLYSCCGKYKTKITSQPLFTTSFER